MITMTIVVQKKIKIPVGPFLGLFGNFWPFLVKFGPILSSFFQLMITKTTVIPIKLKFLAHLALCLEYLSPYFWYELRRVGHLF